MWLLVPIFGALPYMLAGEGGAQRPIDAYFEAVSGFTATGATSCRDFEELSRRSAFWRQFTQWLGGMGIIVLAVAILPRGCGSAAASCCSRSSPGRPRSSG